LKISIGSDHAGYEAKELLLNHLKAKGHSVIDAGAFSLDSVDYPDIAKKVAEEVVSKESDRGILICGTGIGMSIAANKVKGIRAALCHDVNTAKMSREHNDANILVAGARVLPHELILEMADTWLVTDFLADRHQRRIEKISSIEENVLDGRTS